MGSSAAADQAVKASQVGVSQVSCEISEDLHKPPDNVRCKQTSSQEKTMQFRALLLLRDAVLR
jgi:hypothetical protein